LPVGRSCLKAAASAVPRIKAISIDSAKSSFDPDGFPWGRSMISHIAVRLCLTLVITTLPLSPVHADLSYTPTETPDGTRYVLISGKFAYNDDLNEFSTVVRQFNPSMVIFDSPGGNLVKAMELGRLIRGYGLSTVQPRGLDCSSACSLAFIGGAMRFAEPGAIGVHKSSFAEGHGLDTDSAVSAVQHMTAEVMTYMIASGVDPALLQLALQYESSDVRYLSLSEMLKYGVVSDGVSGDQSATADRPMPEARAPGVAALPSAPARAGDIPEARTGSIRHPRGVVALKGEPSTRAKDIAAIPNGTRVSIAHSSDRWYRVEVLGRNLAGYMHHTWVAVDQFATGASDLRHIQIKSFEQLHSVQAYVRSTDLAVSVFVATNGWFAITLDGAYDKETAAAHVRSLKAQGAIPEDSFVTYGNTYAVKLCCD
jgi:hypothetical protein